MVKAKAGCPEPERLSCRAVFASPGPYGLRNVLLRPLVLSTDALSVPIEDRSREL
jgi:hypothetical protein